MTGPGQHAETVREGVEIAKDVLANRRSHDVCNCDECRGGEIVAERGQQT